MSSDPLAVVASGVGKCYRLYDAPSDRLKEFIVPRLARAVGATPRPYSREFWALTDVSFEVRRGEAVGIIGRNGAGKSTLLQILCGTLTPTHGSVQVDGRVGALLELGAGFNPEFTGRENAMLNGQLLGLTREQVQERFDDIASFADIGDFIDQPVKTYSSGMTVRLAFAVSASIVPDVLIVDEALAVGDFAFNLKCFKRIEQLRGQGCSIIFVSHDVGLVQKVSERVLYLDRGRAAFFGAAAEATSRYVSDLTPAAADRALLSGPSSADDTSPSWPTADEVARFRSGLRGTVSGSGAALVEACRVGTGKEAAFAFGDRLVIELKIRAVHEIDDFNVSVYVIDEAGQLVIGTSTLLEGDQLRRVEAGQRISVSFVFENRLREGRYGVTAIVSRYVSATNFEYLDYLEPAAEFAALGRPGEHRWALFSPECEIQVQFEATESRQARVSA